MAGLWDDSCKGFLTTNWQSLVGLDFLGIIIVILLVQQPWIRRRFVDPFLFDSTSIVGGTTSSNCHLSLVTCLVSAVDGASTFEELLHQTIHVNIPGILSTFNGFYHISSTYDS